ncbi:GumC family protein [Janthinobacterium sp. GB4P2]|uniref:GumC family protein n=1 Tax=Janthinobacterium sp. GB4P2 TaxID=3424189 RepID=UPI003F25EDD8
MQSNLKRDVDNSPLSLGKSDAIHFLDLLIIAARYKYLIILCPLFFAAIFFTAGFLLPAKYTSKAMVMLPQQQSSGAAALLGQISGMGAVASNLSGLKNPNDLYVGLLQSQTIADKLIERFDLKARYNVRTFDDARKKLEKKSDINNGKGGLITVLTQDTDPKFSAQLANAYVEELIRLTSTLNFSEASQRRAFLEKELTDAKIKLADAEQRLKNSQEKSGMIQLGAQVQGLLTGVAQLKGMIAAKEVQLNTMRSFATAQNPESRRMEEEIRGLKNQLSKLEQGSSRNGNGVSVVTEKIPEVGLEYIRHVRDVKYYESIFEILAKQFEIAKLDEARDSVAVQVVDVAVAAEKKNGMSLALLILAGIFSGFLFAVFFIFAKESIAESRTKNLAKWLELKSKLS